ncbi:unnamed protein product [Pelagomonas calceolata]|uniref:Uncharacterized protein n=1 Tax=Pelagomonas calceolata TaxID=35677 RepID=A0A7S3ZRE2_9STRA|nr:unnamed protein product [Pelagomonas calceolata]
MTNDFEQDLRMRNAPAAVDDELSREMPHRLRRNFHKLELLVSTQPAALITPQQHGPLERVREGQLHGVVAAPLELEVHPMEATSVKITAKHNPFRSNKHSRVARRFAHDTQRLQVGRGHEAADGVKGPVRA